MPYQMSWCVPNRVVYQRLYGLLTMSELATANAEIMPYLAQRETPYLVHHLIHVTEAYEGAQPELMRIKNSTSVLQYMRHEALGWVIVVGSNRAYRAVGSLAYGIFQVRYRGFELAQFDEALDHLRLMDPRLQEATFDFSETLREASGPVS